MPRFTIVPLDQSVTPIDLVAPDPASVLHTISRKEFRDTDVFCDEEYAFSATLHANGFWTIFEREGDGLPGPIPVLA
jgi:hypothetical protein